MCKAGAIEEFKLELLKREQSAHVRYAPKPDLINKRTPGKLGRARDKVSHGYQIAQLQQIARDVKVGLNNHLLK